MELRNAVTAAFGISLPATVTFDYPTVAALAAFVASRMGPTAAVDAGDVGDGMLAGVDDPPASGRKLRTTDIMAVSLSYPGAQTGGPLPADRDMTRLQVSSMLSISVTTLQAPWLQCHALGVHPARRKQDPRVD